MFHGSNVSVIPQLTASVMTPKLTISQLKHQQVTSPTECQHRPRCPLCNQTNISAPFERWPPTHTFRGKHLERQSDRLWGISQEPQTRFPPHVSILGLWNTSRCFQSNHFWSFGDGGGVAYEMLIKQITYIRGDVTRENEERINQNKRKICITHNKCRLND